MSQARMYVVPLFFRNSGMLRWGIKYEEPPTGEPNRAEYTADVEHVLPAPDIYDVTTHWKSQCGSNTATYNR